MVDDGSTDGSTALAQRWAGRMPDRIRWLEHEGHRNLGMSAARNLGLGRAKGELATFLDADDVLRPEALAVLVGLLDREPTAAMAYAPLEYWHGWDPAAPHRGRGDFVQRLGVPTDTLIRPPELFLRFLSRRAAAPSGVMVRRDLAMAAGGFDEAFRGMYEDQVFCGKICLRWPVVTGAVPVYRYRQHAGSSSALADNSGQHEFGRKAFLAWLQDYVRREGIEDRRVRGAIRREWWWLEHPRAHRLAQRVRRLTRRLIQLARQVRARSPHRAPPTSTPAR
jgi:glycosyltransferase involved in cell wall biosynthesis